jgi:pimeloyl-ACP methyl ester carboxylesterase
MKKAIAIFSGLGSSIIPGLQRGTRTLEKLIDKLGEPGAEHYVWNEYSAVADEIIKQRPDRVALIGHSNGVVACAEIAQSMLRLAGLKVHYIGAIDPTAADFPTFGSNVYFLEEFHASSGWPAIVRRLTRGRNGACRKDAGFNGIHRLHYVRASHVGCASHKDVHATIIASVKEAMK